MATVERARLDRLLDHLESGLVERRRAVRLSLLVALAGEHTLLVGPPGTAKSALARRLHLAFAGGRYFERLLTRFTVPEELFGPLSISALEQDRYERITTGFLPQATIAFIDEVFKANSAILNALLTLLNEREFDNGAGRERCPLISVIGATNEVPDDEVAEAFFDRFLLSLPVGPVSADGFLDLLELDGGELPPPAEPLSEAERAALTQAAARGGPAGGGDAAAGGTARAACRRRLFYVSDRRWVKVAALLKMAAASEGRAEVALWDLWLLPWCVAPDIERQNALDAWLAGRLGLEAGMSPPLLTRVVEAFEAQAQLEEQAEDLDYDESGRLEVQRRSRGPGERRQGCSPGHAHELPQAAALRCDAHRRARAPDRRADRAHRPLRRHDCVAARRAGRLRGAKPLARSGLRGARAGQSRRDGGGDRGLAAARGARPAPLSRRCLAWRRIPASRPIPCRTNRWPPDGGFAALRASGSAAGTAGRGCRAGSGSGA